MCRGNPTDKKPCPVSRDEFKEIYNALIRHTDKNKFTADFWNQFKGTQTKMKDYQKQFKHRRAKILKEPFEMPDAPKVVESGIAIHAKKELEDIEVDLKFDQDDIAKYDDLNSALRAEFLNRCQTKEFCQNLLSWIALEMRFLLVCDALPTYKQKALPPPDDSGNVSALASGGAGDDDDDESHGEAGGGVGGGGGVGVPKSRQRSSDPLDFLHWDVLNLDSIPFKDMGFGAPQDTLEIECFHAACILFFNSDKLTQMHPEVSNALHAAWLHSYKRAMNATDLRRPPLDYSPEKLNWCQATVDFMEGQLDENQRIARGLPTRRAASMRSAVRSILPQPPAPPAEAHVDDDEDLGPTSRLHQFV